MDAIRGFGRGAKGLGRDVSGAANGWFAWSQRNKLKTLFVIVAVMIAVTVFMQTRGSSAYANMNIRYGPDGFPRTDNEAEFVPAQASAGQPSVTGSKGGTQGGIVW